MANASFNSGFYNPATDQVTFYIYWTGITPTELLSFTNADLSVVNASGVAITGASAEVGPGDGNTFPITVSGLPSNSSGQLQVKVRANAIGTSLAVASPLISWSTRSSTAFTIGESGRDGIYNRATGGSKIRFPYDVSTVYVQITATSSISDLTESDIIVSGGCSAGLTPPSGAATSWRLAVSLTDNTSGVVTIAIPANSVSVGNDAKSFSFDYDRTPSVGTPSSVTFGNARSSSSSSSMATPTTNADGEITAGEFYVPINFNPRVTGFSKDDIIVSGACKGELTPNSTSGSDWRLHIDNQDDFQGVVTIGIFSDVTTQSGGNLAASIQFRINTTGQTTTTATPANFEIGSIFDSDDSVVNAPLDTAGSYEIDIQATNKSVGSEFVLGDIVVAGACVTETQLEITTPGRRWRLPISIPTEETGTVTIYIPANVVPDGNEQKQLSFDYNTKETASLSARPTVGLPYSAATAGNRLNELNITADSFYVDISFDTEVRGFTVGDIVVTNACKVSLTPALSIGRQWRLQIDNDDAFEGRVTVIIPSDVTTQSGGNIAASNSYVVNTTQATTTGNPTTFRILNAYDQSTAGTNLTPDDDSILTAETVYIQITSSRTVSDFDPSDIIISNGCVGQRTTITNELEWRIEVGLNADTAGTMTVTIPPNVVSVGNENASKGFQYDRIPAEVDPAEPKIKEAYTTSDGSTLATRNAAGEITIEQFYVEIDFEQVVSGFTKDDVIVNVCKGGLTSITDNQKWRIHIDTEPDFKGVVSIAIPPNATTQSGGNLPITKDFPVNLQTVSSASTVTLGSARSGTSGTGTPTTNSDGEITTTDFYVPITFSPRVEGFTKDDVIVTNACKGELSPASTTAGTEWRIHVDNEDHFRGIVTVAIPSDVTTQSGGNVAATKNFNVNTTIVPATVTIGNDYSGTSGTGRATKNTEGYITSTDFYVEITFGSTVNGFTKDDVIITNACKGERTPNSENGTTWRIHVDNEDDFKGIVTVAIPSDVTTQSGGNVTATKNFKVDTTAGAVSPATITFGSARSGTSGTGTPTTNMDMEITANEFYVPITFNPRVTGFTKEDIIVTNACKGELSPNTSEGTTWRLHIDNDDDFKGRVTVAIPSNVVSTAGGNVAASQSFNVNTGAPSVTANASVATIGNDYSGTSGTGRATKNSNNEITVGDFYVELTFNPRVEGFTKDDVIVTNACKGELSPASTTSGTSWRIHVDNEDHFRGIVTVAIPSNVTSQNGGNLAATKNFNVNTTITPSVVTIGNDYSGTSGTGRATKNSNNEITVENFYVEITFNPTVNGFTRDDVIVTNACKGQLSPSTQNGTTWRIHIDNETDFKGIVTVAVPSDVTTQSGGNTAATKNFKVNTTSATTTSTVTLGTPRTAASGGSEITGTIKVTDFYVPITFNPTVTGFTKDDVIVTNACKGALTPNSSSGTSWRIHIDNEDEFKGIVTVAIPRDVTTQSGGNVAATKNFNVDTTAAAVEAATVTLGTPRTTATGGSEIRSTITVDSFYVPIGFNKSVTGFTKEDVIVAGACKGELTPSSSSGQNWRIHIDNEEQFKGTVTVAISSNVISTAGGNLPATRNYAVNTRRQITPATFVIQSARSSADGTQGANEPLRTRTWYVYITSNISVSGFIASDILVTSANKARTLHTVETGKKWTLQITNPTNFDGIVSVAIPGNVTSQTGGNYGTTRNFVVNTRTTPVSVTPANFSIGPVYDSATGGSLVSTDTAIDRESIYVQIDSGGIAVTDFSESDVIVSGGCAGTFTKQTGSMITDNTRWRLYIDLEDDTAGYITIAIPPNVVSVGNNSTSKSYQYNRLSATTVRVPPGAIFNVPVTLQTGTMSDIRVNFGERVTGLTNTDFQITGHTPAPTGNAIAVLAQDFEIQLSTGRTTAPTITITGATVSSVTRSPNAPASGSTRLWMISLSEPHGPLTTSSVSGATLSRNPSFIDDNYILRITNPTNSEGTLNAILQNDAVRSVDDNVNGPTFQQNSGSYGFDTIIRPTFSIDEVYLSSDAMDTDPINLTVPIPNATIYVEISATSTATGLEDTDIIVTGGCSGNLHTIDINRKWRIEVSIPEDIAGELTVAIPSNVVNEGNQPISKTFSFDRSGVPYLVVTGYRDSDGNIQSGLPPMEIMGGNVELEITAYVNGIETNIDDLRAGDFEITSTDGSITPILS